MAIARFAKVLLNVYIVCMVAGVLIGSAVNSLAKSIYWVEGGGQTSILPDGQPDVSPGDILARR